MPKNKKAETSESSSSDSGPEDRQPPAAKKSKDDSKEVANEWTLEKLRKVKINEFRGRKTVDIREYYEKNGELLPGRKGISLSAAQWKKLIEHATEITAALDE